MGPKLVLIFFQNAMKVMCLTDEEISDVLQVISGVLQLGNVHFMAAGGAQIAEKSGMVTSFLFQNVLMIFNQYWSQQHMMAMHALSQGPARVKFQQVKWPWNRDIREQKWQQTMQSEVETLTVKYW